MAAVYRQPFAPLSEVRLQSLNKAKNSQDTFSLPSGKRKAVDFDTDGSENVDPFLFAKRSKGTVDGTAKPILKPSVKPFRASTITTTTTSRSLASYNTLKTKSPLGLPPLSTSKLPVKAFLPPKPLRPSTVPAGRSPPRPAKSLLSRRAPAPFARVEPPSFSLGSTVTSAPFSLDAALRGTIAPPGRGKASAATPRSVSLASSLYEPHLDPSWFFDIHEDTPEQEMSNLLQHSTRILDISSDEESGRKIHKECADSRNKENIPPVGDLRQPHIQRRPSRAASASDMAVEQRLVLAEMNAADFYAEGCDENSVIVVPGDEEEEEEKMAENMEDKKTEETDGKLEPKTAVSDDAPETNAESTDSKEAEVAVWDDQEQEAA